MSFQSNQSEIEYTNTTHYTHETILTSYDPILVAPANSSQNIGSPTTFDQYVTADFTFNHSTIERIEHDFILTNIPNSNYLSEIEEKILRSNQPIQINESEEISVNGECGIWVNKDEINNWKGLMPIGNYEINQDPNPEIITKNSSQQLEYIQELAIRYLRPPTPPEPGEIIINQMDNEIIPPAPPLIIRHQPPRPITPEPLIIREAPPPPPPLLGRKIITISGKKLPPPPRKVIIEKLPHLPPKPQSVLIERWLPYPEVKRRVIFKRLNQPDPVVFKPRNVIIQWEPPQVNIRKEYKHLGVINANPIEYIHRYGPTLIESNKLPQFVSDIPTPDGLFLAANQRYSYLHQLYGNVSALKYVDLEKEGLGEYKPYVQKFDSNYSSSSNDIFLTNPSYNDSSIFSTSYTNASYSNSYYPNASYANTSYSNIAFASPTIQDTLNYTNQLELSALIEETFQNANRDQNGRIRIEEAEKILLDLNNRLRRRFKDDEIRAFSSTLYLNKDGTLNLEEFKRTFLSMIA